MPGTATRFSKLQRTCVMLSTSACSAGTSAVHAPFTILMRAAALARAAIQFIGIWKSGAGAGAGAAAGSGAGAEAQETHLSSRIVLHRKHNVVTTVGLRWYRRRLVKHTHAPCMRALTPADCNGSLPTEVFHLQQISHAIIALFFWFLGIITLFFVFAKMVFFFGNPFFSR